MKLLKQSIISAKHCRQDSTFQLIKTLGNMANKPSKFAEGQTQIAAVLRKHFQPEHPDFKCQRQYIVLWSKPTRGRPQGFPKPNDANRYNIADCIAWVKKNVIGAGVEDDEEAKLLQRAANSVALTKIRIDEEHKFDFEVKQGKYILAREAEIQAIGLAKRFLAITRDEIRAAFLKTDIKRGEELIDALESKYSEAANE